MASGVSTLSRVSSRERMGSDIMNGLPNEIKGGQENDELCPKDGGLASPQKVEKTAYRQFLCGMTVWG